MRRKAADAAAIVGLAALILLCRMASAHLREGFGDREMARRTAAFADAGVKVVVDPGHGGIDSGKTGVNGSKEKEINLKIAIEIKNMLEKEGVSIVMTREGDERLAGTQREDLRERAALMDREKPVLAVSIHQNSYQDEAVSGAQVFYHSGSGQGEAAARMIQDALNELQPDNTKKIRSNDTYYILKNTEVPVVIAECGFLSNPEEAERLSRESWQREIAGAVAEGVMQYIRASDPEQEAG